MLQGSLLTSSGVLQGYCPQICDVDHSSKLQGQAYIKMGSLLQFLQYCAVSLPAKLERLYCRVRSKKDRSTSQR